MIQALGGKEIIEQAAKAIAAAIARLVESLAGGWGADLVVAKFTWTDFIVILSFLGLALILHAVLAAIIHRKKKESDAGTPEAESRHALWLAIAKPLYLLVWIVVAYFAAIPFADKFQRPDESNPFRVAVEGAFDLGVFLVLIWAAFRSTRFLEVLLARYTSRSKGSFDDLLVPLAGKTLRIVLPVLGIILGLPLIGLSSETSEVVQKLSSLLIIGCIAWVLFQAVGLFEKWILTKYDIKAANNLEARKIFTQIRVLSRTLYFLIALFAIASMLMMFEEVRRFGTSILASAGVLGIIIGFAAQRTIANLFAGFQIAMTQPIRLDDVVIVEGEWGRIEDITLTYVVVRIWDQRRLIVPLSTFIDKAFQNWTRTSSDIMGSVFLWADYTVPVEEIRKEAGRLVESDPGWDKKFWNLVVTDVTDRAIQLRVLCTASDSGKAWDMRCRVREGLITFMQQNHRETLPKVRADVADARPPDRPSLSA